jgi:hypothetical protein
MSFRTILVPIEQHDLIGSTLETALSLARKFDSYIEGFALRVANPAAYAMADPTAVMVPNLEHDIAENAKQTRGLFETFMQKHGVELPQQPCQAVGWKMPLKGTILWAAMAASRQVDHFQTMRLQACRSGSLSECDRVYPKRSHD